MKAYCFSNDLFYPNNTTLSELNMSQSTIAQSTTHNGAYVVTHKLDNFAEQITVEEYYGCVLGGLGHTPAITWTITGRVERVHNWATAQTLVRDNEKLRNSLS
jgi:hypothetical protein